MDFMKKKRGTDLNKEKVKTPSEKTFSGGANDVHRCNRLMRSIGPRQVAQSFGTKD